MFKGKIDNLSLDQKKGNSLLSSSQDHSNHKNQPYLNQNNKNYQYIHTDVSNSNKPSLTEVNITQKTNQNHKKANSLLSNSLKYKIPPSKTEKIYSDKILDFITQNDYIKNLSINVYESKQKGKWVPEGYLYYDFILKHPNLTRSGDFFFVGKNRKNNIGDYPQTIRKFPKIKNQLKIEQHKSDSRDITNQTNDYFVKKLYNNNQKTNLDFCNYYDYFLNKNKIITDADCVPYNKTNKDNKASSDNTQYPAIQTEQSENKKIKLLNGTYQKFCLTDRDSTIKQEENNYDNLNIPSDKYRLSDVFNRTNDKLFTEKSGENYLFNKNGNVNKIDKYTSTTESGSVWIPKSVERPTLINHASVDFNILCPNIKGMNYTKDSIKKEVDMFYKVNAMSQFIDLNRVSAPNINEKYRKIVQDNDKEFRVTNQVGACFQNLNSSYKDLVGKPFTKSDE